jgi:hypothetical protein
MEKQIITLTSGFLSMNRFLLFLLLAFPFTIKFDSPLSEHLSLLNHLLASIGGICWLSWLFAIGHKANSLLASKGKKLDIFKYFNWSIVLVMLTFIVLLFVSKDAHTTVNGMNVSYKEPLFLTIIFSLSFLSTLLISSKTLVSAELNKEATAGEYLLTTILMISAPIGLWFIQPRVQSLPK